MEPRQESASRGFSKLRRFSEAALRTSIHNLEESLKNQTRPSDQQASTHYKLGEFYEALGRNADAAQHFSDAFTLDRFYGPAYGGYMRTF